MVETKLPLPSSSVRRGGNYSIPILLKKIWVLNHQVESLFHFIQLNLSPTLSCSIKKRFPPNYYFTEMLLSEKKEQKKQKTHETSTYTYLQDD